MATPLPAHIRRLTTVRDRDLPKEPEENAAQPVTSEPPVPLEGEDRRWWDYYHKKLRHIGAFTDADGQALAILACLTAEYWRAVARYKQLGEDTPNNVRWTAQNHVSSVEKRMNGMLNAFGLTPAARVKVGR